MTFIAVAGWTFWTLVLLGCTLVNLHMLSEVFVMAEGFLTGVTLIHTHHLTRVELHMLREVLLRSVKGKQCKVYIQCI